MNRTTRVKQLDLWVMLLGYVRYAMGRMSTAPSMAQDFVKFYGPGCNKTQLQQIRNEVADELANYDRMGKPLGMDCDHRTWQQTLAMLDEQLAARAKPD